MPIVHYFVKMKHSDTIDPHVVYATFVHVHLETSLLFIRKILYYQMPARISN